MTEANSTPAHGSPGVRDLLLLADDEDEVLDRARKLLVPMVGDDLAVSLTAETSQRRESGRPDLPPALPWPPEPAAEKPAGRVWFAAGPDGTWTEYDEEHREALTEARWFTARLGGTPSAGWVLLERSPERPPVSPDDLDLLRDTAAAAGFALIARTLSRQVREARTTADAAAHRWAALARANALLVRSPEYDRCAASVLEAVVPYLADWAVLTLMGSEGRFQMQMVRHTDEARQPLLARLRPFPALSRGGAPAPGADQGLLLPEVEEPDLRRLADPEDLDTLRALGPRSLSIVPLRTGGRSLATLTLATAESGQVYTPDDLGLFRSVAQHAALALTSAEMYRDAQRARREREEVLAIVSHDLKNPIHTVGLAAAILETAEIPAPRREAQIGVIGRAVGEMNELIERLLDAARIDSGRFSVRRSPVAMDALVSEALRRAAPAAEGAGVRLEGPEPCGATVLADRSRILQVFGNLLGNAVSFTPPNGRVRLAVEVEAEEVVVRVRDDGPGMDEETQRHVFDRFWQARRTGRAGAGLGLSIARGIVHAHDGRIGVVSRPGEGSEFHFTVPRATATGAAAGAEQTESHEA